MALEIEKRKGMFKMKQIWFADYPYDVRGVDRVIFRDCKNKVDAPGFKREKFSTLVIDLTQDLATIWGNMSSGNCQKPIRRALRADVKVKFNQNYNEFYNLYKEVRTKKRLSGLMPLEDVKRYGTLFVAELQGKIISGHGYLENKDNMRSWVTGSKCFGRDKKLITTVANASKLIIWEAIQYAKEKGMREFDMGGYYTGEVRNEQKEGINRFKKAFGGELVIRYIYQKDYSEIYKNLSLLKQKLFS